jgi:glycosyltransferase involved in cell wall biosynthesis
MQRPLRVLLEASCLGDGRRDAGIGRYASQLIDALRGTPGLEVTPSVPATPAWSEARPARFLRAQPHVLSDALARHPHLVHGLGGEPVIGFPPSRQVVTLHDVEMWRGAPVPGVAASARRLFGALLAPAIRACAGIIAVSETTRFEAIATLDLDPSRIHVVPHGVGAVFSARPKLRDARTAEALGLDEPFVLWVGSLRSRDPRKGLDTLLQAMERLPGGGPPLALVGALGPEADRLAADAWRRRLRLVLTGAVDDVELASLYRQAAVVVLPSTHEGFGLTALEAMACGAPLVATAVGNLPQLTQDAAVLVPPGDPAGLSEAIEAVLTEPVSAARMRHAGIDRASGYTWGRTAEMTAVVYEQVALHSGSHAR